MVYYGLCNASAFEVNVHHLNVYKVIDDFKTVFEAEQVFFPLIGCNSNERFLGPYRRHIISCAYSYYIHSIFNIRVEMK